MLLTECELTSEQFEKIAVMLYDHAGIRMREGKEGLVRARLTRRLRKLGLNDFESYLSYVQRDRSGVEFAEMVDALTTNKTSFLRESSHFDFLGARVLPVLRGPVRLWSAGCSTGEEPYTLAMLVNEVYQDVPRRDIRILASDISHRVLATARTGNYAPESMTDVPANWIGKYWLKKQLGDGRESYEAGPELRRLIQFSKLNLMEAWPMQGQMDAIFCRNVMIYFDKETQQKVVDRFWAILRPGGYLFVGHSESLTGLTHRFRYVQPAIYVK